MEKRRRLMAEWAAFCSRPATTGAVVALRGGARGAGGCLARAMAPSPVTDSRGNIVPRGSIQTVKRQLRVDSGP